MLNLDPWNILFTVINLLIFFLIIKFFLLKPVRNIIDKREKLIEQEFTEAADTKKAAEDLKAEYEGNIQSAQKKAAEITADAKKTANAQRENILNQANNQARSIVEKAQKDAKLEYDKTISKLESEIAGLALAAAAKVVKENVSENDTTGYDKFLNQEDN
ncbi:MAG: F0F1 ATP synthase subunit B [Oscillospiraceae bacterium]|nr:F0F1 ATP synthase subunit B [Oscillospiraceae bacterium]